MKTHTLKFRAVDKATFEAIRTGDKSIETRAGSPAYQNIQKGETLIFSCAGKKFSREIKNVRHFKTIGALIKKYPIKKINPFAKNEKELRAMYHGFPGYEERIKEFGLLAFELERG